MEFGYMFVFGGMDNYLILCDLCLKGVDGVCVEKIFDLFYIIFNKNLVSGDISALIFGGIRIGSFVMMMCGMMEVDFVCVVNFID